MMSLELWVSWVFVGLALGNASVINWVAGRRLVQLKQARERLFHLLVEIDPEDLTELARTLVDLARQGRREEFVDLARMSGLPVEDVEPLWAGTLARVRQEERRAS